MENVSLKTLERGIRYWRDEKPKWPRDFHCQFYKELAVLRADGLTERWWRGVVPCLRGWRAIRPLPTQTVVERGLMRLEALGAAHTTLMERMRSSEAAFDALAWEDVAPLYDVAHAIKGVTPPVFGSKLCHFLAPAAFPVIDGDAVGIHGSRYEAYWKQCRDAWQACDNKPLLIARLQQEITEADADYPWAAKITELCGIGRKAQANDAAREKIL